MVKWIISRLTMVKLGEAYYNKVTEKQIYYWKDYYFDRYTAASRWGFRVKLNNL